MGRCNTGLKFTCGSFNAQSFSWALVEAQGYLVEIGLRIAGQVGFLREVLSQQAIGVFVGAALPGALRITEVDLHLCVHDEALVFGHLQASVPGQRTFQRRREFTNLSAGGNDCQLHQLPQRALRSTHAPCTQVERFDLANIKPASASGCCFSFSSAACTAEGSMLDCWSVSTIARFSGVNRSR
jgi:hypothetical protein